MTEDTLFPTDTLLKDDLMPWQRPEPRTLARSDDPETSHEAAKLLGGKAGTMRRGLLKESLYGEGTAEEIAQRAGYGPEHGAWKRMSDLLNAGLLEATGATRPGSSGRQQRVLRITVKGREALT